MRHVFERNFSHFSVASQGARLAPVIVSAFSQSSMFLFLNRKRFYFHLRNLFFSIFGHWAEAPCCVSKALHALPQRRACSKDYVMDYDLSGPFGAEYCAHRKTHKRENSTTISKFFSVCNEAENDLRNSKHNQHRSKEFCYSGIRICALFQ